MNYKNISIIIPAYEPDDKIIKLIDQLEEILDANIIVVNDGSSSKCEKILEQVNERIDELTVIVEKMNKIKNIIHEELENETKIK